MPKAYLPKIRLLGGPYDGVMVTMLAEAPYLELPVPHEGSWKIGEAVPLNVPIATVTYRLSWVYGHPDVHVGVFMAPHVGFPQSDTPHQ